MPQYGEFVALIEHRAIQLISQREEKESQAIFAAERAKNTARLETKRQEQISSFEQALQNEKKRIVNYRKESKIAPLTERQLDSLARETVGRQNAQIEA
jgi:hypothetical protein